MVPLSTPLSAYSVGDAKKRLMEVMEDLEMTKRVLVVEDTPIIRDVLLHHLNKLKVDCYAVETGEEAVELAAYSDLILMDVNLPGITGIEATRRIRKQEREKNLDPVTIVANTNSDSRSECLTAGMDDFYSKAVTRNSLQNLIDTWLFARPSKKRLLS